MWAPVSAYLIHQLYGNSWLTYLAFFEEILPLMDVIPTATIAWAVENRGEIGTLLIGRGITITSRWNEWTSLHYDEL